MYFLSIITSLLLFTTTNGFIQKPNNLIATKLNFKMYIDELPIKDLLGDINNHKISKLVIDRTYQDITSIDNDLITKHMTHINPIMLPSIIDKTMENNIEVTFLKPDLITQLFNDFDFLFSNVIMPFFFISLFINIFRNIGRFNNMNMPSSTPNMFNPFQQKIIIKSLMQKNIIFHCLVGLVVQKFLKNVMKLFLIWQIIQNIRILVLSYQKGYY